MWSTDWTPIWEVVREEVKKQQKDGNVDPARAQTMQINIDKAKERIPEAVSYDAETIAHQLKEFVANFPGP